MRVTHASYIQVISIVSLDDYLEKLRHSKQIFIETITGERSKELSFKIYIGSYIRLSRIEFTGETKEIS